MVAPGSGGSRSPTALLDARGQLIENVDGIIGYLNGQGESLGRDLHGEPEEGTARRLALNQFDHRAQIGTGRQCDFEPMGRDPLRSFRHPVEYRSPLAQLPSGSIRIQGAGNGRFHTRSLGPTQPRLHAPLDRPRSREAPVTVGRDHKLLLLLEPDSERRAQAHLWQA